MRRLRFGHSVAALGLAVLLGVPASCSGSGDVGPEDPAGPAASPYDPAADQRRDERVAMVEDQIAARGVEDPKVLEAMRAVPRHAFVPADQVDRAYRNRPLPIGEGQTISQPYIVGLMTELLDVQPGDAVLEIGTGSGYQAAVLAELTDRVYTVEIIAELARRADAALERTGYGEVEGRIADGYFGWQEHAPYDAIVVTAAPDHIPAPLVEQLAEGGHMVIPVGPPGSYQTLWRLRKEQGRIVSENITDVAFVPLVRRG